MSNAKGTRGEREILHQFWGTADWAAIRVPASGAMPYPSPDVLAGNHSRKLAIECKVTSADSQYFSHEQIDNLREFSRRFGAEPWVSIKFLRRGTFFVSAGDLKKTPKHYVVSLETCQSLGLSFEDITRP